MHITNKTKTALFLERHIIFIALKTKRNICSVLHSLKKWEKNVLYIATAISLLLKGKRLSDPHEVTTRPFKCLSSPKQRDLQTDSNYGLFQSRKDFASITDIHRQTASSPCI